MKTFILLALAAIPLQVSSAAFASDGDVHERVVGISDVYSPSGFDSGSDVFVVASGLFPNSCYSLKNVEVKNVGPYLHEVTTKANVTEGLCLMVIIPFHREVQLGKLSAGTHKLHFMNGDDTYMEKQLIIEN
ncbi:MAG: hypothetical protein ACXVB9_18115 [Bdellovibrionota bacterium]